MKEEPAYGPVQFDGGNGRVKKKVKEGSRTAARSNYREGPGGQNWDPFESSEAYYVRMQADVLFLCIMVPLIFLIGWFQWFGSNSWNACSFLVVGSVRLVFIFFDNWKMALQRAKEEEEYFKNRN